MIGREFEIRSSVGDVAEADSEPAAVLAGRTLRDDALRDANQGRKVEALIYRGGRLFGRVDAYGNYAAAGELASPTLCYAGTGDVHLTLDGRSTLCGRDVYDEPTLPRGPIEPLSCEPCHEIQNRRVERG